VCRDRRRVAEVHVQHAAAAAHHCGALVVVVELGVARLGVARGQRGRVDDGEVAAVGQAGEQVRTVRVGGRRSHKLVAGRVDAVVVCVLVERHRHAADARLDGVVDTIAVRVVPDQVADLARVVHAEVEGRVPVFAGIGVEVDARRRRRLRIALGRRLRRVVGQRVVPLRHDKPEVAVRIRRCGRRHRVVEHIRAGQGHRDRGQAGLGSVEDLVAVLVPEDVALHLRALEVTEVRPGDVLVGSEGHNPHVGGRRHDVAVPIRRDAVLVDIHQVVARRQVVEDVGAVGVRHREADLVVARDRVQDAVVVRIVVEQHRGVRDCGLAAIAGAIPVVIPPHQVADGAAPVVPEVGHVVGLSHGQRHRLRVDPAHQVHAGRDGGRPVVG